MATVKASLDWRPTQVKRLAAGVMERRMVEVEGLFRSTYQDNVGLPYPPASRPGQYPRRRSGALQHSIRSNVNVTGNGDRVQLSLSNNAVSSRGYPYPAALEYGTSKMAPRPHLRPTFDELIGLIRQLLLGA